jgi:hypothetical protein
VINGLARLTLSNARLFSGSQPLQSAAADRVVAEIDEICVDLAAHVIVGRTRNQHAARLA